MKTLLKQLDWKLGDFGSNRGSTCEASFNKSFFSEHYVF